MENPIETIVTKTIRLRRGFTEIARVYEMIQGLGFIAGGYARYCASPKRKPIPSADLDIFPLAKEGKFEALRDLFIGQGFELEKENDVSYTFKPSPEGWEEVPQVQLIKPNDEARILTYGEPWAILGNFDFTITRAAITSPTEVLVDADFEEDEKNTHLRLKNIHCPVSSLFRSIKYAKKGYFLRPIEAIKLFLDWQGRDDEYRAKLLEFVKASETFDPNDPESSKLSEEDIEKFEKMMMID